VLRAGVPLSNG